MKTLIYALSFLFAIAGADAALAADSPMEVPGAQTIDAATAKQLFDKGVTFVDVRKGSDFEAGRVPGAHHLELKKAFTGDSLGQVAKKDSEVVIYCNGHSCMRSSEASAKAVEWGYSKIYYFRDGMPAWQSAGYPVE
jgi:rhodanese-related sulfurtransferase